jgi:anti-anti-sigma factor
MPRTRGAAMNNRTDSPDAPVFQVNIQAQDGQLAILLGGKIDAAALEELRLVVNHVDTASDQAAVLDLSALTSCDPAGLSELAALKQLLNNRHPSVTFRGVTPKIRRIIDSADVHHHFSSEETAAH